jgi:large subunit ribosomal protein L11
MAKKKVKAVVKIAAPGGKAVPGQKLGPVLGQHGVNIGLFCTEFNAKTIEFMGLTVACKLFVYDDRSFEIVVGKPIVSDLIKQKINLKLGSGKPNKEKVGKITHSQIEEIAKYKMSDFNTDNLDSAMKIVEGSAKSMGLDIQK